MTAEVSAMGTFSKLNRPVQVVDYDFNWPTLYESEKTRILAALGIGVVQIEHVGSTSVPGLAAKPVIDIVVGVDDLEAAKAHIPVVEHLGYNYEPNLEAALPQRLFFWRGTSSVHMYHLTVAETASSAWIKLILFRDYLRRHPDDVLRYQELKRELAMLHGSDMHAYVQGKIAFVLSILSKVESGAGSPTITV